MDPKTDTLCALITRIDAEAKARMHTAAEHEREQRNFGDEAKANGWKARFVEAKQFHTWLKKTILPELDGH